MSDIEELLRNTLATRAGGETSQPPTSTVLARSRQLRRSSLVRAGGVTAVVVLFLVALVVTTLTLNGPFGLSASNKPKATYTGGAANETSVVVLHPDPEISFGPPLQRQGSPRLTATQAFIKETSPSHHYTSIPSFVHAHYGDFHDSNGLKSIGLPGTTTASYAFSEAVQCTPTKPFPKVPQCVSWAIVNPNNGKFYGVFIFPLKENSAPASYDSPPHVTGPTLTSVAATGPDDVWAVGYTASSSNPTRSTILHFNGTAWSQTPTPDAGQLDGVAAISPTDAWAIAENNENDVILHWDGSEWSKQRLPHVRNFEPAAIEGSGPDNVWLVGSRAGTTSSSNSVGEHTLTMHWNGTRWSIVRSPNEGHNGVSLSDVVTSSPSNAWAVGQIGSRCLTLHWQGKRWAAVPVPNVHHGECEALTGVGQDSRGDLWAVGGGNGNLAPWYLKWTGRAWLRVDAAPGDPELVRASISGTTPTDFWAGGCDCDYSGISHLVNGSWRPLTNLKIPDDGELHQLTTISPTDAWAVGFAQLHQTQPTPSDNDEVLIMHWNGQSWTAVNVPGVPTAGFNN